MAYPKKICKGVAMAFGEKKPVEQAEWPLIGLTLPELAQAMRVNQRTILGLLAKSDFPGRKVGTGWRFSAAAVEQWLGTRSDQTGQEVLESDITPDSAEPVKAAGPISKKQLQEHLPEVQKMFKLKDKPGA